MNRCSLQGMRTSRGTGSARAVVTSVVTTIATVAMTGLVACGTVEESARSALENARVAAQQAVTDAIADAGLDDLNRDRLQDSIDSLRSEVTERLPDAEVLADIDALKADLEAAPDRLRSAAPDEVSETAGTITDDLLGRLESIRDRLTSADLPPELQASLDELERRVRRVVEGLDGIEARS